MASNNVPEKRSRRKKLWKNSWRHIQNIFHLTRSTSDISEDGDRDPFDPHSEPAGGTSEKSPVEKGVQKPSGTGITNSDLRSTEQNSNISIPPSGDNPLHRQPNPDSTAVPQLPTQNNFHLNARATSSQNVEEPPLVPEESFSSNDLSFEPAHNGNTVVVSTAEISQQIPQNMPEASSIPLQDAVRRVWSERQIRDEAINNEPRLFSIQAQIPCKTITLFREERIEDEFPITWLDHNSYNIVKDAHRTPLYYHLERLYGENKPRAYRTCAEAELLTDSGNEPLRTVGRANIKHGDAWAVNIPTLIAKYGAENPFKQLRLQITWKFDWYDLHSAGSLAEKIRLDMITKFETNHRKEKFLPRGALEAVLTDEHIRELINQDDSLGDKFGPSRTCKDRTAFIDKVLNFGTCLLASCIMGKLRLSRLHGLVCMANLQDHHLPLVKVPKVDGDTHWFPDFHDFEERQKIFQVYDFDKDALREKMQKGLYEIIEEWVVVPILGPGRKLGSGSFGIVHEIRIHQDHHNFEENIFALKQLYTPTQGVSSAFRKEYDVFSNIMKVEHPAILIPLAMWRAKTSGGPTQDEFCMLYPIAETNLAKLLRQHRQLPTLTKDFVLHLMRQLLRLAEGLDSIHRLAPSNLLTPVSDVASTSLKPPSTEDRLKNSVCHRDLKPANILIFHDGWKISDFGTARINQIVSGKGYAALLDPDTGDLDYSPPDCAMGTPSGRKYDIWSFGCILLEILLTLFEPATDDQLEGLVGDRRPPPSHRLDAFYGERLSFETGDIGHVARFWYKDESLDGQPRLLPPVVQRLDMLRRKTSDYDQFDKLLELVGKMLSIEATDRPTAQSVLGTLKTIDLQMRANLAAGNDEFYMHAGSHRIPFASQPTTEAGTQRDGVPGGASYAVHNEQTQTLDGSLSPPGSPISYRRISSASSRGSQPAFDYEDVGHLVAHSGPSGDVNRITPHIQITASDDEGE